MPGGLPSTRRRATLHAPMPPRADLAAVPKQRLVAVCTEHVLPLSDQDTEDWCMHAVITNPKFPQSQVQCFPQLWWKLNQIYGLL